MRRHWTAILLSAVAVCLTVPAVLAWGPTGFIAMTIAAGIAVGLAEAVDWVIDRWPDDYPQQGDP